MAILQGNEEN